MLQLSADAWAIIFVNVIIGISIYCVCSSNSSRIDETNTRIDAVNTRLDSAYKMFYDLLKETKK